MECWIWTIYFPMT
jgi:hypothetical protein